MKRIVYCAMSAMLLAAFACSAGCAEKEKTPVVEIPEGYTRENGENMFWENEDTVKGDTVVPNVGIRIYNYAPSIFEEDENTRHAYYCSNKYTVGNDPQKGSINADGNAQITDYIAYRKGVKLEDGNWYWSEKSYVLSPLKGSETEGKHICDPNVIKGEFTYNGETYPYLMAYLAEGFTEYVNEFNNISLAVAKSPEGPWKRCGEINPLKKYTSDDYPEEWNDRKLHPEAYLWGWGQASMVSVDKKGRVMMAYSSIRPFASDGENWRQTTMTTIDRYDFSNLNDIKKEYELLMMPIEGIMRGGYQTTVVSNGDFAYEPKNNRMYMITDGKYDDTTGKAAGAPLSWIDNGGSEPGDVFKNIADRAAAPQWSNVAGVSGEDSLNNIASHNTAIIRDAYGWLKTPEKIEVAITGSCVAGNIYKVHPESTKNDPNASLWSFRILRKTVTL